MLLFEWNQYSASCDESVIKKIKWEELFNFFKYSMEFLLIGKWARHLRTSFCELLVQNVRTRATLLLLDLFWLGVGRFLISAIRNFIFEIWFSNTFLSFMATFPFFPNYQNIKKKFSNSPIFLIFFSSLIITFRMI